jgi:hypothetical protein
MSWVGSLKSKIILHWSIFCIKRSWRRLGGTSWNPGSFSSSLWRWSEISNLDECWRFGVLIPSEMSLGVVCNRSKAWDFLGGARSPGIVSAAPGGGTCFRKKKRSAIRSWTYPDWRETTRIATHPYQEGDRWSNKQTYRCTWADHHTRGHRLPLPRWCCRTIVCIGSGRRTYVLALGYIVWPGSGYRRSIVMTGTSMGSACGSIIRGMSRLAFHIVERTCRWGGCTMMRACRSRSRVGRAGVGGLVLRRIVRRVFLFGGLVWIFRPR